MNTINISKKPDSDGGQFKKCYNIILNIIVRDSDFDGGFFIYEIFSIN